MASALNNAFKNSLMEKFSDINSVFKGLAWDDFSPARLVITRARQTGKSYEKAWMDEFLNTPEASTENKQSMLEINLAASLKALKDRTAHSINAEEIKEIHMPIEDEELDDQTDLGRTPGCRECSEAAGALRRRHHRRPARHPRPGRPAARTGHAPSSTTAPPGTSAR